MKKGFSLVEILLYIAILSIFLIVALDIFIASFDVAARSEAVSLVDEEASFLAKRLAFDIRRAQKITLPAALGEVSSQLDLLINSSTYSYSQSATSLILTTPTGINNLNGNQVKITGLSFQKLGNPGKPQETVKIKFTLESASVERTKGPQVKTFETTVGLR